MGKDFECAWVLRNITDPEAINSAIRLAGTIRWFDGDSNYDPPLDVIVSAFEACFDSTKQPYPGMRDRAYFSARAILQINMRARIKSHEHASKYPIPIISSIPSRSTDVDLHHVVRMLKTNASASRPSLPFPESNNTRAHSLWLSNLLVDLTRAGPNPVLEDYWSHLIVAETNYRPTISNILVMWYMLLGGHVEEETFWAVDKSDSLETILSSLSLRVMNVIAGGNHFKDLNYLFDFLAAWEERPVSLTPMAYQWCSAISEVAGQLGLDGTHTSRQRWSSHSYYQFLQEFTQVGSNCDLFRLDNASHIRDRTRDPTSKEYLDFLAPLRVAFRLFGPTRDNLRLGHTSHLDRVLETAFLSVDDEVVADAACAWINSVPKCVSLFEPRRPAGSWPHSFAKRVGDVRPFSPRLRQMAIRIVEEVGPRALTASGLEAVCLLNRLDVTVGDLEDENQWHLLLVEAIRSPMGENLTSHYWHLLDELMSTKELDWDGSFGMRDVEVMRLLEEAEDWEKLETWMVILWNSRITATLSTPGLMGVIGGVTLNLVSLRPSALQRFEDLRERVSPDDTRAKIAEVCDRARAGRLSSERRYSHQSVLTHPLVPFPFAGDDTF